VTPREVLRPRRAAFALLRWLWAGQWRASPGRAATAVIAIAIGVALALGIHLVNRSALEEFDAAIAVVNGEAQVAVTAPSGHVDESVFAVLAAEPGIAAASPVVSADVPVVAVRRGQGAPEPLPRRPRLPILGIDVMRAAAVTPSLLPAAESAGAASAVFRDDTIFLAPAASRALGVTVGDRIVLGVGLARVELQVAGTVPGAAPGQQLAVMDLGAAQWRLGWLGRLSRIDLRLAAGVTAQRLAPVLAPRLPAGLAWTTPETSRQRMSNLSRAYRVNLDVLALVALFTGGFIVYATIALGVQRQLGELALLGVLGGSRRLLGASVLGQGAVLGALGALLGVAGGIGLAAAMLALVGGDLGGGYFRGSAPALSPDLPAIAGFAALGVAVGVLGSLAPARALHRLSPARALRAGSLEQTFRRRRSAAVAAVLAAAGAALLALPPVQGLPLPSYAAIAAWLLAGIVFVPVLTRTLGGLLVRGGRFVWRHPAAWLAVQRVHGAPGSAAAALSGVVASVALAGAMAIMVNSFRVSVDRWLDTVLPADLYGRTGGAAVQAALDPALQAQVRALPGVARAEFLRVVELTLDAARPPVALLARPLAAGEVARQLPITGALAEPPADAIPIWVSEAMVDLYGFTPGRRVALPLGDDAAQATLRFLVAGVWRDYARQHGAIAIDARHYRALSGDDSVSDVALWLAPGATPAAVLDAIRTAQPALGDVDFRSAADIRALSLAIFDRSFALTYVLEAIAIVVGLFGVAATYAGEAIARAREFGMLRHLGVTRAQVASMFAAESATLITAGVAWGGVLGVAIALVLIHRVNPQSFHWTMDVAWPIGLLGATAASLVALGVLAAVLASRSASGTNPVRAVREDW